MPLAMRRRTRQRPAAPYLASHIRRQRATKAEVEARREALLDIIDDGKPMTVRQAKSAPLGSTPTTDRDCIRDRQRHRTSRRPRAAEAAAPAEAE